MHILIIPSWYTTSYNELSGIFFKEQAEALAKYNDKVGVIALQDVGIRNIIKQKKIDLYNRYTIENDVHTYRLQYLDILKNEFLVNKFKMFYFKRIFKRYINEQGFPDIVHLHSSLAGDFALYLKEKYHIPFIVTEHLSGFSRNTLSLISINRAKNVFKKSEYNIAVSQQFKKLLENKFNIICDYIPNIVNINFFNIKNTLKKNTYNFINIAMLVKNKNQEMLIKSFYKSFKNNLNVHLTIVGDGNEYENLKKLVQKLNMTNQITLHGRASRLKIKELLHQSDAFVLSSKYETFGVVIIEAMACGIPVVTTKCGGPESIVVSDKIGFLCEIEEDDLSKKLLKIYENRLSFDSNYIRGHVINNFSEEAICLKLNEIYKDVLK